MVARVARCTLNPRMLAFPADLGPAWECSSTLWVSPDLASSQAGAFRNGAWCCVRRGAGVCAVEPDRTSSSSAVLSSSASLREWVPVQVQLMSAAMATRATPPGASHDDKGDPVAHVSPFLARELGVHAEGSVLELRLPGRGISAYESACVESKEKEPRRCAVRAETLAVAAHITLVRANSVDCWHYR